MESMASDPELDMDEGDLEKLESDVKQMAKKISEYRQTLPDHLRNTLDSALSSHIPVFPNIDSGSDPLPSSCLTIAEAQVPGVLEEQDSEEKWIQLKERMSRNAANIPKVVKRMRECIESIDKLDSLEVTIHPAFKRQRIN
ncbi:hypothetical protein AtNW77_Chr4g0272141 [Arabidopsis thaliana]|jgi:hypothetical protein|uniref:At4g00525 n=4 Tax=Arabidopsis TaxID=3701 RepID=Q6AWV5_ARATH|nr:uncharacterized protein AT4G00525 [Arabidopsis thaliana]KAG7614646.1 hypothetical protein ISN45_At04g000680 [Arabidopsis thaliana x Arabidopsis arenosa]KAG7619137.1 hypothetical protein ISN44_As04g000680 [Arabidopsis suecica]AAT85739.1 At4g00525 [Arabidopsis thaliana]AAU15158.1 At4g00525 [Arabidopsis thaliana]AEE81894.1 hypothetical protein AT4G00525 [Arabidopsis thaliana]|eukprot:NP_680547.2 hypothetical protein AT4G00525 [Arabidopsis thaliana]